MADDPKIATLLRLPKSLLERIDEWRRVQKHIPSRPQAIRELVELSLDETDRLMGTSKKPGTKR